MLRNARAASDGSAAYEEGPGTPSAGAAGAAHVGQESEATHQSGDVVQMSAADECAAVVAADTGFMAVGDAPAAGKATPQRELDALGQEVLPRSMSDQYNVKVGTGQSRSVFSQILVVGSIAHGRHEQAEVHHTHTGLSIVRDAVQLVHAYS